MLKRTEDAIRDLRASFPVRSMPQEAEYDTAVARGYFCVGGAFCATHGLYIHFPGNLELSRKFADTYGGETQDWILFAAYIISANDVGEFNEAWRALGIAIRFGERKCNQENVRAEVVNTRKPFMMLAASSSPTCATSAALLS